MTLSSDPPAVHVLAGGGVPTRVCLAGEDLDWIGNRCLCLAVSLYTRLGIRKGSAQYSGIYLDMVWRELGRLLDVDPGPAPPVSLTTDALPGSGLSSSTSLVVALTEWCAARVGAHPFDPVQLAEFTYAVEYCITRGGGMDHVSVIAGGVAYMQGREVGCPAVLGQASWPERWAVVLIESGDPKSCADHIAEARARVASGEARMRRYVHQAEEAADLAWNALRSADLHTTAAAINAAHEAMRDWADMSTDRLERLRDIALEAGFPAVKLTGSGSGGSMFAISDAEDAVLLVDETESRYASLGHRAAVRIVQPEPVRNLFPEDVPGRIGA